MSHFPSIRYDAFVGPNVGIFNFLESSYSFSVPNDSSFGIAVILRNVSSLLIAVPSLTNSYFGLYMSLA